MSDTSCDDVAAVECASPADEARNGGYLAICAIMMNEGIGILEWIAYHRAVGVEKFYLYDHGSQDDTIEKVLPLVKAGIVDLTHWTMRPGQLEAYDDFAARHGRSWTWCAFIDLDEFINPFAFESIPQWLRKFDGRGAVAIQWLNFGTSGYDLPPTELAIEAYYLRLPDADGNHQHVKTIVRMCDYERAIGPHSFAVYSGDVVNERMAPVKRQSDGLNANYALQEPMEHDEVCVNHYYTKSRFEWLIKTNRGCADYSVDAPNPRRVEWLQHYEEYSVHVDRRILKFADRTSAVLNEIKGLSEQ